MFLSAIMFDISTFPVTLTCRKLGTAGQRMGGSAALCHIRHDPVAPSEHGGCFTLKTANVGRCQAVLCRDGKAMQLSNIHTVKEKSEYQRVRRHNAIITEVPTDCRVTETIGPFMDLLKSMYL